MNGLRRARPVSCRGTQVVRLNNVMIDTQGPAFTVRGACRVEVSDSYIRSDEWAIRANGQAQVFVTRSSVEGARGVVKTNDSAVITARDSLFIGAYDRQGRSTYRDNGGNEWRRGNAKARPPVGPAPAPPPPVNRPVGPKIPNVGQLRKARAVNCRGNKRVRIANRMIDVRGPAFTVRGACRVEIVDSYIRSGEWAIRANGRGSVTVKRSYIEGALGAVKMNDSATLTARRSVFSGAFDRQGNSVYRDNGGNDWQQAAAPTRPSRPAPPPPGPAPINPNRPAVPNVNGLQRSKAVSCRGKRKVLISRQYIDTRGPAVTVRGNCMVEIVDSYIRSSNHWAVRMNGNSSVTIRRSHVEGVLGAVQMNDRAALSARRSLLVGALERKGNSTYRDNGGNDWQQGVGRNPVRPSDPAPPPPPPVNPNRPATPDMNNLRRAQPVNCRGNQNIKLNKVLIDVRGPAIVARGDCRVEIIDSYIRSQEWAIRMNGRARVTVKRSHVEGKRGAAKMNDRARLNARRALFIGNFDRKGQAEYRDNGGNEWTRSDGFVPPPPTPQPAPAPVSGPSVPNRNKLRAQQPVSCRGNETVRLKNVIIDSRKAAIIIRGKCKVELIDSYVRSGEWAIRMNGRGSLTVKRSYVEGARGAAKMNDQASLNVRRSQFVGAFDRQGNAVYRDNGGNDWRQSGAVSPAPAPPPPAAPAAPAGQLQRMGPVQCRGNETLNLDKVRIDGPKNGITVRGSCSLVLSNSEIQAGNVGIRVLDNGKVTVRRSTVKGTRSSIKLTDSAQLKTRNSTYVGPVVRQGKATLRDNGGNRF